MQHNLIAGLLKICGALNEHAVEYLIVGGTAVALHGYFRLSVDIAGAVAEKPDLDFWYNPAYDNYFRLLDALESLGQDVSVFRKEKSPKPRQSFFKYQFDHFTLDLLPQLKAPLLFRASFAARETAVLKATEIPFISFEDLIRDKEATDRPKDRADVIELKRLRSEDNP